MSFKPRHHLVFAICFAVAGIVFVTSRVMSGGAGKSVKDQTGIVPNTQLVAELDSVESFIEPTNPEECSRISEQLTTQAFLAFSLEQEQDGKPIKNERQLRQLIQDRIRLILDPDYNSYIHHLGDLLEMDGREALHGTMFADEKLWDVFSSSYKHAGIAIDTTRVTRDLGSVTLGEDLAGGRQTTFGDPGVYGSKFVAERGGETFSVVIPMMLPPQNEPGAKLMVVFATLSFVWDDSRSKWIPYRTAVHDPSGTSGALPPLWM